MLLLTNFLSRSTGPDGYSYMRTPSAKRCSDPSVDTSSVPYVSMDADAFHAVMASMGITPTTDMLAKMVKTDKKLVDEGFVSCKRLNIIPLYHVLHIP